MTTLSDQAERDRFVREHGLNLSVIAPAGVGKTTSIVERIVALSSLPEADAVDALTRLVVVTFSVRAAQQLQQRARISLRKAAVPRKVRRAFQHTFFGTIHSYCVRLLDRFGHYIGLPSPVSLLEQDDDVWERFLRRGISPECARDAPPELFHFIAVQKLYGLGRSVSPGNVRPFAPLPAFDFSRVLAFVDPSLHHATRRAIRDSQDDLEVWLRSWNRGERHRSPPSCTDSKKAVAFREQWHDAFAPLHAWICQSALAFGRRVANAYESFRLAEALMTYNDQVRLAMRALEKPEVRRELAADRVSVLLDEAQDTDRLQFEVLRRVAGLADGSAQPDGQTFSIVGDFQQAIYAPRSDLATYKRVHEEIIRGPRGARSELHVTFRCDTAIIEFVNRIFPSVLDAAEGQSTFHTLQARSGAGPGRVARWLCPSDAGTGGKPGTAGERAEAEATFLAQRLVEEGLEGLGVTDWSDVAILCPRHKWLAVIDAALRGAGVPVQLHSPNEPRRERAAEAWVAALVWVAAHPEDSFEIAGVLREIFGVPDSDMALFTNGEGDRLRLDLPTFAGRETVTKPLESLRGACAGAESLPLDDFMTCLVTRTQLRARLEAIGERTPSEDLDDVMQRINARCAEGATLAGLAEEMRTGLAAAPPLEEEIRDAVQLLTSHKSKGLEWPVVIVPFVFRRIEERKEPYPRVLPGLEGEDVICRDKADFTAQARELVDRRNRQQYQRLYYVMATRAKRSLIWVDDEELYRDAKRGSGFMPGELLGFASGQNREAWLALGDAPAPPVAPAQAARNRAAEDEASQEVLTPADVQSARARAQDFARRVTPHALAVTIRDEAEPEAAVEREDPTTAAGGPGVRYGTWWHEMVQAMPWTEPREAWQVVFERLRKAAPDASRARREWKLFLDSELARHLAIPGTHILAELPFLWRGENGRLLEGVMDLAMREPDGKAWRVIDWKTNRVPARHSTPLVDIYRGQINAYVQALEKILKAPVKGSLYLTRSGEWLDVE
jgi:ATP-dependent exoDNAse (exonuclease V) beta subunit